MRSRLTLFLVCSVIFTSNLLAKDVYLSIAGTVGVFRTDLRIVNPSPSKDITVQAYLLPASGSPVDNSGVQPKAITITKRQMAIYNDVVTSLFNSSGLAAIRLTSDDDFIATERIYATTSNGTLGQFVIPVEASNAKTKGIIPQLASSAANRTNLGLVNPNNVPAHVAFTLYDKNNAVVTTGNTITMPPFGATSPLNITSGFWFNTGGADLTDTWVSYSSDVPVIGWGSAVDNASTDQIFVPPFEDTAGQAAKAKDVYLAIAGTVGAFRTDLRIVNPSQSKDITLQAYLLPASGTPADNSAVQPKTIIVPKRQMAIYNDVVTSLFNASGLASIRLKSDDDFIATERIYATTSAGTLGQFVIPVDASSSRTKGVITQLASSSANRTNLGLVNPNSSPAHVAFTLYDKNNAIITTGTCVTMPPFSATSPLSITSGFWFNAGNADLSDAWVSYNSDVPVIGWGSVVDNVSTDQIFVPPFEDTGVTAAANCTPPPTIKEFDVKLESFQITITPDPSTLKANDKVIFHIHNDSSGTTHGFELNGPDGRAVVPSATYSKTQGVVDRSFTMNGSGNYAYFCTIPTCGSGHSNMGGFFTVGTSNDPPGDKY